MPVNPLNDVLGRSRLVAIVMAMSAGVAFGESTSVRVRIEGLDPSNYSSLRIAVEYSGGQRVFASISADGTAECVVPDLSDEGTVTARIAPKSLKATPVRERSSAMQAFYELIHNHAIPEQVALVRQASRLEGTINVRPAVAVRGTVKLAGPDWKLAGVITQFGMGGVPVIDAAKSFEVCGLPANGPCLLVLSAMPRGGSHSELLIPVLLPEQGRTSMTTLPEVAVPNLVCDAKVAIELSPVLHDGKCSDVRMPSLLFVSEDRSQVWRVMLAPDLPAPLPGQSKIAMQGDEVYRQRGAMLPSGRYAMVLLPVNSNAELVRAVAFLRDPAVDVTDLQHVQISHGNQDRVVVESLSVDRQLLTEPEVPRALRRVSIPLRPSKILTEPNSQ